MTNSLSLGFRERFMRAFQRSKYTSYRSLSLDAGVSENRVQRIASGHFDDSRDGPGFYNVIKIAEKLGVTPDYLAGVQKWVEADTSVAINAAALVSSLQVQGLPPDPKDIARTYLRSGGRIEAFEPVLDYCDLYDLPCDDTRSIKIRAIGRRSLAALRVKDANPVIIQEAVNSSSPHLREKLYQNHKRIIEHGFLTEIDIIDERMTNRPEHVKIEYLRISALVEDNEGRKTILICCQLIPQ